MTAHMSPVYAVPAALLLALVPSQARDGVRFAVEASANVCLGLSEAECCAQRLDYAGYRALGERLPERAQKTLSLSCGLESRVMTQGACRTIVSARGFGAPEVDRFCQPTTIERSCAKDGSCRTCMTDLARLSYRETHNACHAVTYAPPAEKRGTVVIRSAIVVGRDGYEVTNRRYELQ